MTGVAVSDTQTGLRAFSAELLDFMSRISGSRYEYEMNMLASCAKKGIPIREVPIRTIYHDKENSCSHFRRIRDSVRIYRELFKFFLSSFSSFLLDSGASVSEERLERTGCQCGRQADQRGLQLYGQLPLCLS